MNFTLLRLLGTRFQKKNKTVFPPIFPPTCTRPAPSPSLRARVTTHCLTQDCVQITPQTRRRVLLSPITRRRLPNTRLASSRRLAGHFGHGKHLVDLVLPLAVLLEKLTLLLLEQRGEPRVGPRRAVQLL